MNFKTQLALGLIIGNYVSTLITKQDMVEVHQRAAFIATLYVFVEMLGKFGPERSFLKDLFAVFSVLNVKRGIRNLHAPGALARTYKTMKRREKEESSCVIHLKRITWLTRKRKPLYTKDTAHE